MSLSRSKESRPSCSGSRLTAAWTPSWIASASVDIAPALHAGQPIIPSLGGGMPRGARRRSEARRRPRTTSTPASAAAALASVFGPTRGASSLARPPGRVSKLGPAGRMQSTGCCSVLWHLGFADTKSISHLLFRTLPTTPYDDVQHAAGGTTAVIGAKTTREMVMCRKS